METTKKNLLYSAIAFNLSYIRPIFFHTLPIEYLREFLPFIKYRELGAYLPREGIDRLNHITRSRVEHEIEEALKSGARIISFFDELYPMPLKHLADAPPVLYLIGRDLRQHPKISIVGPRRPTQYGRNVTTYLIQSLADHEIETVSGLALGIDALVHRLSIALDINTVAITGTGIDITYPFSNQTLFNKVKESGTIVSEFPCGTPPLKYNFPRRNRIIAALSEGTLVVEAGPKSGSLITASFALNLGRNVFAVPGDIFEHSSKGTNELILQGAKPVLSSNDILSERPYSCLTQKPKKDLLEKQSTKALEGEIPSAMLKDLLNFLVKPRRLDNIIDFCKEKNYKSPYSILTTLEFEGLVIRISDYFLVKAGYKSGKKPGNCGITGQSKTN